MKNLFLTLFILVVMNATVAFGADTQSYIVLKPAQPKALQPFDAQAFYPGASTGKTYSNISVFDHEVKVEDQDTLTTCSDCPIGNVHAEIPGLPVGDYTLQFGAYGGPDVIFASATFSVTTDFKIDSGVTGSWYEPRSSGQGFNFEIVSDTTMLVYFYTFDAKGNPTWLFGTGPYSGNTASIPLFSVASGSPFENLPYHPTLSAWGTLTLAFSDCDNAEAAWTTTDSAIANGYVPESYVELVRITTIPNLACVGSQ